MHLTGAAVGGKNVQHFHPRASTTKTSTSSLVCTRAAVARLAVAETSCEQQTSTSAPHPSLRRQAPPSADRDIDVQQQQQQQENSLASSSTSRERRRRSLWSTGPKQQQQQQQQQEHHAAPAEPSSSQQYQHHRPQQHQQHHRPPHQRQEEGSERVSRTITTIRWARSMPTLKVEPSSNVGRAAGYIKLSLGSDRGVLLVAQGDAAEWQAFRALRCARTMLLQDERMMPIFQPVLLQTPKNGLEAGTMCLYTQRVLAGQLSVRRSLSVTGRASPERLARAALAALKETGGAVALDCRGRWAALVCLKAIAHTRSMLREGGKDVSVALDTAAVELPLAEEEEAEGHLKIINRFVLLPCAVDKPTQFLLPVTMKTRPLSGAR